MKILKLPGVLKAAGNQQLAPMWGQKEKPSEYLKIQNLSNTTTSWHVFKQVQIVMLDRQHAINDTTDQNLSTKEVNRQNTPVSFIKLD